MNSRWNFALMVLVVFIFCAASGCGDDGEDSDSDAGTGDAGDTDQGDLENPLVSMNNVVAYQGVSGVFGVEVTATDDVGIERVDLLVDGEVAATSNADPFTISWDTTALAAGAIAEIAARAVDLSGKTAETDPVTVVVVNGGYAIEFVEAFSGEISIPDPYVAAEFDKKLHWTPSTAASRILSIVLFTVPDGQPEWQLALEIGTGECPDIGETLDAEAVDPVVNGPFVWDSEPTGGYPGGGLMFYHLRPGYPADHPGESVGYEVHAYAFN
jgi:hypothetical protein